MCFDKILALNPEHTSALLRRATTLIEQGSTASAMESLQIAVRNDPNNVYARYHFAQVDTLVYSYIYICVCVCVFIYICTCVHQRKQEEPSHFKIDTSILLLDVSMWTYLQCSLFLIISHSLLLISTLSVFLYHLGLSC